MVGSLRVCQKVLDRGLRPGLGEFPFPAMSAKPGPKNVGECVGGSQSAPGYGRFQSSSTVNFLSGHKTMF